MVYDSIDSYNSYYNYKNKNGEAKMNKSELYDIAQDAINDAELRSSDIPPIDLYVDQILNLMSERLAKGSERYLDKQLTKTMINNYSKDGLITPVKGKKYNKEQILQMLTIYTLKGTFSIGEIKRILDGAYTSDGFDAQKLTDLYDRHLDIKEINREFALAALEGILERNKLNIDNDIDYIITVCALASFSAHLRNIAQAMIDARYPEPIEEDSENADEELKKEKKEEKKAEKKAKKEEKKAEKQDKS